MTMLPRLQLYNKTGAWRNIRPEIDRSQVHPVRHLLEVLPRRRRSRSSTSGRSWTTTTARAAASAPRNARRSASSWWRSGNEESHHGQPRPVLRRDALAGPGHLRLPDHAPDPGRRAPLGDVRRRDARRQVHQGRVRALGHGRLHRRLGRRGADLHRHLVPGPGPDARDAPLGRRAAGIPSSWATSTGPWPRAGRIWTDQNDSLSQRDTGWMQFYCASNQEVLDTVIQAFKVAETLLHPDHGHPRRLRPVPHLRGRRHPGPGPGRRLPAAVQAGHQADAGRPARLRRPDRPGALHGAPLQAPEGHGEGAGPDRGDRPRIREGLRPPPRPRRPLPVRRRRVRLRHLGDGRLHGPGRRRRAAGRPASRPGTCASRSSGPSPSTAVREVLGKVKKVGRRRPELLLRPSRHLLPGGQVRPLRPGRACRRSSASSPGSAGATSRPDSFKEIAAHALAKDRPDEEIVWIGVKK